MEEGPFTLLFGYVLEENQNSHISPAQERKEVEQKEVGQEKTADVR